MEAWLPAMSACHTYAEIAVFGSGSRTADVDLGGTYSGDGGCAELIHKALNNEQPKQ